jgi:hypothetical protein
MADQKKIDDGGPAFPIPLTIDGPDLADHAARGVAGMTLRDYFAAHAPALPVGPEDREPVYPGWFEFDAEAALGPCPPSFPQPEGMTESDWNTLTFYAGEGYAEDEVDRPDLIPLARELRDRQRARRAWRERRDALKFAAYRYAYADLMLEARKH